MVPETVSHEDGLSISDVVDDAHNGLWADRHHKRGTRGNAVIANESGWRLASIDLLLELSNDHLVVPDGFAVDGACECTVIVDCQLMPSQYPVEVKGDTQWTTAYRKGCF